MTANGWAQIIVFLGAVLLLTRPLGLYLARVFERRRTWLDPLARPAERLLYRLTRVDETHEMRWTEYGAAMLLFSLVSFLVLYAILRLQSWQTWGNPQALGPVPPYLAFNTAVSFTTNTNWQAYGGESTVSYLTQMAGLAYQNFVSSVVGIALAVAFVRGIARRESATLGNFWVDLTRATLWVLLPMCLVGALVLVSQGVVQNFRPYDRAVLLDPQIMTTMDGAGRETKTRVTAQVIAQGPVASQEIIKELGTNGGGFFGANSSHPFENPTPLTNFLELVAIFAIPAGLVYMLGEMTGSRKHGWTVWAAMTFLFLACVTTAYWAEAQGNPLLAADQQASALAPGGNMEGKEARFGIPASVLFATVTTDASCGAINSTHDSFTPIGGMVPLVNIMLGEVIFGGVGAGLYGMPVFVILAVFIAGLMVGRTPEYLGKKIEAYDVQMSMLAVLIFPLTVLLFAAVSVVSPSFGTSSITNPGPHGLTQILYAFVSAAGNNGSAFGGLLSAIGIAGMDRLVQRNVLAMSGRAVEAAGDVHTLLLDKTGTITLGNRQAAAFLPLPGVTERDLADAAQLASLPDETPEGRSIVVLAKTRYGLRGREVGSHMTFLPFSAQTRMSGVDINGRSVRKGAAALMRRNLIVHGAGGLLAPFVGIKVIDMIITMAGLA